MICQYCHFQFEDDTTCPACDSGSVAVKPDRDLWKANAKTLGFTDAKLLHETPSWGKAGSIFSKS